MLTTNCVQFRHGDVIAFNRPNTRTTELVFMLGDNLKQGKAGFAPFGKIASKAGQYYVVQFSLQGWLGLLIVVKQI